MTEVPPRHDLDGMVDRYLGELELALARLPVSRRDQLVGEIREHITELRSERSVRDASDMEALLNRVGLPEDIAAVALEDVEPADLEPAVADSAAVHEAPAATPPPTRPSTPAAPTFTPTPALASPPWRPPLFSNPHRAGLVGAAIAVALVLVVGIASLTAHSHGPVNSQSKGSPSSSAPPARLVVPDVVGQSQATATVTLQSEDFGAAVVVRSSTSPAGTVVAQSPAAGALADRQTTVTLDVSSGPSLGPS
jgi:hypothetical protein